MYHATLFSVWRFVRSVWVVIGDCTKLCMVRKRDASHGVAATIVSTGVENFHQWADMCSASVSGVRRITASPYTSAVSSG